MSQYNHLREQLEKRGERRQKKKKKGKMKVSGKSVLKLKKIINKKTAKKRP